MNLSPTLKIIGFFVFAAGIVLASSPELISSKPVPEDIFRAVERRIWWGVLIGLGLIPLFHGTVKPWLPTIIAVGGALTFGVLIARLIGIALDGSVLKQWFWVAVEFVILIALWVWYSKLKI